MAARAKDGTADTGFSVSSPNGARRMRRHSVIDHLSHALGEDWTRKGVPMGPRAKELARVILEEATVYRKEWALKEILRLEETIERIYNGLKLNVSMPQLDALMEMVVAVVTRYIPDEAQRLACAQELLELTRRVGPGTGRALPEDVATAVEEELE